MGTRKLFLTISIICYCLIMLQGMIIPIPFIFVLFSWLFEFRSFYPVFAISGIGGISLLLFFRNKTKSKRVLVNTISFGLLIAPLSWRLSLVPLQMFNNWQFIVPTVGFFLFYLLHFFYKETLSAF